MSLGTSDLTLLATLKTRLGITSSSKDAQLEAAIKAASRMIVAHLGRDLAYSAALAETVAGTGTTELSVNRPPIWSVTSITSNGDTVDSANYGVRTTADKYGGVITCPNGWLRTPLMDTGGIRRAPLVGHDDALFVVTYVAGWVTPNQSLPSPNTHSVEELPTDIEEACLMLCQFLYARHGADPSVQSESLMSYSVTYGAPGSGLTNNGLPVGVAAMLQAHRVLVQA